MEPLKIMTTDSPRTRVSRSRSKQAL